MGVLIGLLERAMLAGLTVVADGDRLRITGPKSAAEVVKELAAHKAEVLEHLAARKPVIPPCTRCKNPYYRVVTFHDGQSSRRECARCNLTAQFPFSFPRWKGDWA